MPQTHKCERGFTLIEVLISLTILGFMMTMAWYTTSTSASAKDKFEKIEERNHEVRIAMARMVQDISSAYISANENQNLQQRRTVFVGKSHGSVDDLRFSSLGHRTLWADANESEQSMIVYFAEDDRRESSHTNLLRRELRRLSNENWENEPAEIDILLRDVDKVEFEYFDWRDNEWKKRWDTTAADGQRGRLPTRVRITVEIPNQDRDDTIKFTTQARIMMQEELKFFAN